MTDPLNPFDDPELRAFMQQHGVRHQPGMAAELLEELAPLLAAEGVDFDDPALSLDELNAAMEKAVEQRHLYLFTPVGRDRANALRVLLQFTQALEQGDADRARQILDAVQPEETATQPAGSHLIGLSISLVDSWLADPQIASKITSVRIPSWNKRAKRIASDIFTLGRKHRAFDSIGSLITRNGGLAVSDGASLLVAAVVQHVASIEGVSVAASFEMLTGESPDLTVDFDAENDQLEYSHDELEAIQTALASVPLVSGAVTLLEWIGKSKPVTDTGNIRRADLETVSAMIGARALGVAKLPAPGTDTGGVVHALSMADVPLLHEWWGALISADVIELTASRVRPGARAHGFYVNGAVNLDTATRLIAIFVAELLLPDPYNDEDDFYDFWQRGSAERAIALLIEMHLRSEGMPSLHPLPAPNSDSESMIDRAARHKLKLLAKSGLLVETNGEFEMPAGVSDAIAQGIELTLHYLED